jgi:WD40 repeat protein
VTVPPDERNADVAKPWRQNVAPSVKPVRIRAMTTAPVQPPPIVLAAPCSALALPRNDTLLVLTDDGVLTRWHLGEGDEARAVTAVHVGPARTLLAAPRSTSGLVVAPDGTLVVFDLDERAPACARFPALPGEPPTRCAWLGQRAALLVPDGRIALYGADGATATLSLEVVPSAFDASPDGQSLVLGDAEGDVTVLAVDGTTARRWHAHDGGVIAVVCLADRREVVTAGRDGVLGAWELASGIRRAERNLSSEGTLNAVRPEGSGGLVWVTTTSIHTNCAPWNELVETAHTTTHLYSTAPELTRVSYTQERDLVSPDLRWMMCCSPEAPTLYELRADDARYVAEAPSPARRAAVLVGGSSPRALVPHGDRIERWGFVGTAVTGEARPFTRCTELRFLSEHVLLSAHGGNEVWLRDATTAAPRGPFGTPSWKLRELQLAASGRHVVHAQYAAQLMHLAHTVVSLGDGDAPPQLIREVPDFKARVTAPGNLHVALATSRDCFVVVTRDTSPRLELRDVATDALVLAADAFGFYDRGWVVPGEPLRLAVFPSTYRDDPMVLWDVAAARPLATIAGPTLAARRACAHPDGTRMLTYCPPVLNGSGPVTAVVLWRFDTRTSHVLEGHATWPTCVAFAPDGRCAISADEAAVIAWDLETCTRRWTLPLTSHVGKTPERLHFAGSGWLLVERGLFGPHLVVRLDDGACIGTIEGAQAAPVHTTAGAALIGVIDAGELVLHDAATCAPIARWRGAAEATAWTQLAEPPWVLAVGDACGDLALLDPPA